MPGPDIARAVATAAQQRFTEPGILAVPWRVGRRLGRTLYAETGGDNRDADVVLGMVDSAELATHIVTVHNASLTYSLTGAEYAEPDR